MGSLGTAHTVNVGSNNDFQHLNYNTHGDAILQFRNAMIDTIGHAPDSIIGDGKLHRFKINGKLDGAYILHLDGRAAGYFQDFKQGIKHTWKASGKFMPLSKFQRQAFKAQCQREAEQRQKEEIAKHKAAANKAAYIWNNAHYADSTNPYLVTKKVLPHGAKLGRDNSLMLPLFNAHGGLVNLQFITHTGAKRFLSGGQKKGCFFAIGEVTDTILICEGFATGASLFEDKGLLTIVAFDAGNLTPAAEVIRGLYPQAEIIIAGDNDLSGIGEKKAREAALTISGKYIIPPTVGMDWNDVLKGGAA
jgi:putative DNA primase/helicase